MPQSSPSVIKLKNTAIELLDTVPCTKITVALVLEHSGIARRTFYKYFKNMQSLWHSLSHDTIVSVEKLTGSLILSPSNSHPKSQKSNIQQMANLSSVELSKYMSDYLLRNRNLILCLSDLDPYFLKRWKKQTASLLAESLCRNGYTPERSNRMAGFLSKGLVESCLTALRAGDRQAVEDDYMGIYDMLYVLCAYQKTLQE